MHSIIKEIAEDLRDLTSRDCHTQNLAQWLECTPDVAVPDLRISTPQTQVLSTPMPVPFKDRTNFISPINQSGGEQTYSIPPSLVASCLISCKSRVTLAGLAVQIFSRRREEITYVRGALAKKRLDPIKVNTIFTVNLQRFPLD